MQETPQESSTTPAGRPGLLLLELGLACGVLGDVTLRRSWGLGATLMATVLTGLVVWLQRCHQGSAGTGRVAYALACAATAFGFAWRDAEVLKALDALTLGVLLGLLASEREDPDQVSSVASYLLRVSGTAAHVTFGPPLLLAQDIDWPRFRVGTVLRLAASAGRGLVVALPILLLFTLLLVSADPVFALGVEELLDVDLLVWVGHLAFSLVCAWMASGFLRAAVLRERPVHRVPLRPGWLTLGGIEITMVLGSLDLLFGAFVWIQLRYLFGGSAWVQRVAGLTYAEYARRGFFELVTATALVLPLLLVLHWLLRTEGRSNRRTFAALAGTQVLLVLVMLASAFERMRLYCAEYGLTELRFYTTAFMAWLGAMLVWFAVTALRARREAFARGALIASFTTLVLLHIVDPEAEIARTNGLMARSFDVSYALTLGADAAPTLVEIAQSSDTEHAGALARGLLARWVDAPDEDWQEWNRARARARSLVSQAEPELRAMARAAMPAVTQ
jgi:hypothetical protein